MHDSPRFRRLKNDFAALDRLRSESSIFHFKAHGNPPHHYQISLRGKGLCREHGKIKIIHSHNIEIKLGSSYPRTIPEIRWLTPIYHPNISEIGLVCLGGYGTHWVPSVQLDELCTMLWDMTRYHNYDIRSPYNRDAALWVANQTSILFPTDSRPLRDVRVAKGRIESGATEPAGAGNGGQRSGYPTAGNGGSVANPRRVWGGAGSAADARSPVVRIREFIERYSRSISENSTSERPAPAEGWTVANGLLQATAPATAAQTTLAPSDLEDEVRAALRALDSPAEPTSAPTEELIVLEDCGSTQVEPARSLPAPAGEDILYIE
jgi:ubiquitin-protein ligase